MLTGKQKRFLKALGSALDPIVQIGKAGVAPTVAAGAREALLARELIKVRVLRNSPDEAKDALAALAEATGAELVQVIGHNGLLYKRHPEKPKIELPE
ncbi:MAG: ribosome assembly RNA-binding protein YhbY [Negativicutes bacterium]|nr:ribosome assembly RNA-binding protein YhbY [Negativicutes bacterium]